jgi:hypothetical protein
MQFPVVSSPSAVRRAHNAMLLKAAQTETGNTLRVRPTRVREWTDNVLTPPLDLLVTVFDGTRWSLSDFGGAERQEADP